MRADSSFRFINVIPQGARCTRAPGDQSPVHRVKVGCEAAKKNLGRFKPSDIVKWIILYGYTTALSNLDRLRNASIVSCQPETEIDKARTLAYRESTTFPTCSNVSIAAP